MCCITSALVCFDACYYSPVIIAVILSPLLVNYICLEFGFLTNTILAFIFSRVSPLLLPLLFLQTLKTFFNPHPLPPSAKIQEGAQSQPMPPRLCSVPSCRAACSGRSSSISVLAQCRHHSSPHSCNHTAPLCLEEWGCVGGGGPVLLMRYSPGTVCVKVRSCPPAAATVALSDLETSVTLLELLQGSLPLFFFCSLNSSSFC